MNRNVIILLVVLNIISIIKYKKTDIYWGDDIVWYNYKM